MPRAFLIVMDSVGCGGAPDAAAFGDAGANTLAHIAAACAAGRAEDGRSGPLRMPVLDGLGLGAAIRLASGDATPGLAATPERPLGGGHRGVAAARTRPRATGNWRACRCRGTGPISPTPTPPFPRLWWPRSAALPGTDGILGNCHASGVPIIEELGAEHMRTGWPICYTSADSVFQIAAHEEAFGLDRLLRALRGAGARRSTR